MKLHKKLSHLNEKEISELIKRYYSGENINLLISAWSKSHEIIAHRKISQEIF